MRSGARNATCWATVEPSEVRDLVVGVAHRRLPGVPVVEDNRAVALGERRQLQAPALVVGGQAHDAQQRLTGALLVVEEADAVDVGEGHGGGAYSPADGTSHHRAPRRGRPGRLR